MSGPVLAMRPQGQPATFAFFDAVCLYFLALSSIGKIQL